MDNTAIIVEQHKKDPYLDSLAIVLETLFYRSVPETMDDDLLKHKLNTAISTIEVDKYTVEDIRKAIQLAILKGMKDSVQPQHLMTPETVALLVGYLVEKLTKGKQQISMFDPACGTANLLTIAAHQLSKPVEAFASEIDPTLLKLALASANLQQLDVEFFHQDSLRPFLLDPVDVVVADLPVGYYPDDQRASEYELKAAEGHSYAHHLFIEQSLTYTKAAGYLVFIIPNFLFTSDQADKLNAYLHKYAHIVGLLQLPESAFKSHKNAKSILILQKKGNDTKTPKQPLLVKMPSFKNATAMEDIFKQMNDWFAAYEDNNNEGVDPN